MNDKDTLVWYKELLLNNRFWILLIAVVVSVNIAGFVQLFIPSGSLQAIRIEQIYGFISITLLYFALLASPLTTVFPKLPGKGAYLHARRAIGVSAFYYAFLHACISLFGQLGGLSGLFYLDTIYTVSLIGGILALGILLILAATSLDIIIKKMGFKNWKNLQRFIYLASLAVLLHVVLIGTHFAQDMTTYSYVTYTAVIILLLLESIRIYIKSREAGHK